MMSEVQTTAAVGTQTTDDKKPRQARLIINPMAFAGGGCDDVVAEAERVLREHGYDLQVLPTSETDHGRGLAHQAAEDQVDLVIAAGGDGTVHEVITGMLQHPVRLGILPLGTMNNVARSVGIPDNPMAACQILGGDTTRQIDVGLVNGQPFMEIVSIGMEAPLFPLAEELRHHGLLGAIQGAAGALRLLGQSRNRVVTLELNGRRHRVLARQITIGNAPYFALGMQIDPYASISDGQMEVLTERFGRRRDLLMHYWSIVTGSRELHRHRHVRHARRVRVQSQVPMPVAVDGVARGATPVTISLAVGAITVLAPPPPPPSAVVAPPVPPLQRVWRALLPRTEGNNSATIYAPEVIVGRWRTATIFAWLVTLLGTGLGLAARDHGWWPFQKRASAPPLALARAPRRDALLWHGIILVLRASFLRLRLPLEVGVSLAAGGVHFLRRLLRLLGRVAPQLPDPDPRAMSAVATTGVLAAGLWTSRKATWRRNALLAGLGGLAAWFATSRPAPAPNLGRQRDSLASGVALGATWLSLLITGMALVQRVVWHLVQRPTHLERQVTPHTARTPSPPPANPQFNQSVVPVAQLQPLERGDIVLFGPDGTFGARMIELATRSHYHHVAIYDGEGMVIEAMPHGVRRYFIGQRNVTGIRPRVSPTQRARAAEWARAQIGKPYDTPGLALIAFDRLLPGLRLGSSSASRFSCAVFIADAYMQTGVDLLPGQRWQDLVPGDYVQLLDQPPKM